MKGSYLFYIQLILVLLLFYLGNFKIILNNIFLSIILLMSALTIGFTSLNLGPKSFSPFPTPSKTNELKTNGLFKYSRHPIYAGLIIMGLILLLSSFRLETFIVYTSLIVVLNIKADLEEEHLSQKHKDYKFYAQKTRKFFPFLY